MLPRSGRIVAHDQHEDGRAGGPPRKSEALPTQLPNTSGRANNSIRWTWIIKTTAVPFQQVRRGGRVARTKPAPGRRSVDCTLAVAMASSCHE